MKRKLLKTLVAASLLTTGYSFAGSFMVATHIKSDNRYIVRITPVKNKCILSSGIKDSNVWLRENDLVNSHLVLRLDPNCYTPNDFKYDYVFEEYSYPIGWKTIPYNLIKETNISAINVRFDIEDNDINLL